MKLKPGQKGTKALVEKYGEALVCVRYRFDERSREKKKGQVYIQHKMENVDATPWKDSFGMTAGGAFGVWATGFFASEPEVVLTISQ